MQLIALSLSNSFFLRFVQLGKSAVIYSLLGHGASYVAKYLNELTGLASLSVHISELINISKIII